MPISVSNLTHIYALNTPFQKTAVQDINLSINDDDFIAIAGHTGSGKSTLIQLIAGLIKPTSGTVIIDDIDLASKNKVSVRDVRRKVGIVFQYPETQLFEETVELDIAFAPKNFNLDETEIKERVHESMQLVGLPLELKNVSPFNLSGGQKRKVAIAGVLAMRPKFLILDEPTAGLDPFSRQELLQHIKFFHNSRHTSVILISHSMDDIAQFANRIVVMSKGRILSDTLPIELFKQYDILNVAGLSLPTATQLLVDLHSYKFNVAENAITVDEAENFIINALSQN